MKRNAKIVGRSEDGTIEVTIRFKSSNSLLTKHETDKVVTTAANRVADAVRALPYVDFGPHNTHVTV